MDSNNRKDYHIQVNNRQEFDISAEDVENLDMISLNGNEYHLLYKNKSYRILLEEIDSHQPSLQLRVNGKPFQIQIDTPLARKIKELGIAEDELGTGEEVIAPMPGKVISLLVKEEDEVEPGQELLILEAMKMENIIKAKTGGIIQEINVTEGDAVNKNALLLYIEGQSGD